MGCSTALFLARGGMRVAIIDRGGMCREASGVNGGTLTLHMTRAALIPYAMRGWEMWLSAPQWLGRDVGAHAANGLSLAFTEDEVSLLEQRARARRKAGAPIELIPLARAREIEPGLSEKVRLAAYCPIDGAASHTENWMLSKYRDAQSPHIDATAQIGLTNGAPDRAKPVNDGLRDQRQQDYCRQTKYQEDRELLPDLDLTCH